MGHVREESQSLLADLLQQVFLLLRHLQPLPVGPVAGGLLQDQAEEQHAQEHIEDDDRPGEPGMRLDPDWDGEGIRAPAAVRQLHPCPEGKTSAGQTGVTRPPCLPGIYPVVIITVQAILESRTYARIEIAAREEEGDLAGAVVQYDGASLDIHQGLAVHGETVQGDREGFTVRDEVPQEKEELVLAAEQHGAVVRDNRAVGVVDRPDQIRVLEDHDVVSPVGNADEIEPGIRPDHAVPGPGDGPDAPVGIPGHQVQAAGLPGMRVIAPDPVMLGAYPPLTLAVLPDAARPRDAGPGCMEAPFGIQRPDIFVGEEIRLPGCELPAEPEIRMRAGRQAPGLRGSLAEPEDLLPLKEEYISGGIIPDAVRGSNRPGGQQAETIPFGSIAAQLIVIVLDPEVPAAVPQGDAQLAFAVQAGSLAGHGLTGGNALAEYPPVRNDQQFPAPQGVEHVERIVREDIRHRDGVLVDMAVEIRQPVVVLAQPKVVAGQQGPATPDV